MFEIDKGVTLREQRRQKLQSWLVGGNGNRWANDDKRILHLDEFQFWPKHIQDAEIAYFQKLDAEYESNKVTKE